MTPSSPTSGCADLGARDPEQLQLALELAEEIKRPLEDTHLEQLSDRYRQARDFAPRVLAALELRANPDGEPVLAAVELLRELNRRGGRRLPDDAPVGFVPRSWRPYVNAPGGGLDRRHWELCLLSELRSSLRAGEIWVAGSRRYTDPERFLTPRADWPTARTDVVAELELPNTADERIDGVLERTEQHREILDHDLQNGDAQVTIGEHGNLSVNVCALSRARQPWTISLGRSPTSYRSSISPICSSRSTAGAASPTISPTPAGRRHAGPITPAISTRGPCAPTWRQASWSACWPTRSSARGGSTPRSRSGSPRSPCAKAARPGAARMLRTVTDGGRRVGLLPRRRLRGMTWSGHELPMAPRLRARRRSLVAQLDRYRRLGTTAISITHRELQLVVRFDADADLELLRETIAIERQCCSFFTLDYDASDRRLSITVDNPDRLDALRALLSALRGSGIAPAPRRSS